MKNSKSVVFLYDISNRRSFEGLVEYLKEIFSVVDLK